MNTESEILPQRRFSETFDFAFPRNSDKKYALTAGCYEGGKVGEVFVASHRHVGSQADLAAREIAILISIGLQRGASLDELARAVTSDDNNQPDGLAGVMLRLLLEWERNASEVTP